jgi:predicted nucleic acid-binding protein
VSILVDANVLSEATRPAPDPRVVEWLRAHQRELVIDPIILGELRFGILLLPRGKRRTLLERWFEQGVGRVHCVPWDAQVGQCWAELLADLRKRGRAMPIKDSLIAATARALSIPLATLNTRDFESAALELIDPRTTG